MKSNLRLVFITCKNRSEANLISKNIVKSRLGACCNTISPIKSLYWWKGKTEKAEEVLLLVKTKDELLTQLIREVKRLHSYEVPEIIALPIVRGNKDYLKWVEDETTKRKQ